MPLHVKQAIKQTANTVLSLLGFKIVALRSHDWTNASNYIPFEETLEAARRTGLSVGDYIDTVMNKIPGATQSTIDKLSALGVFSGHVQSIVEIGPGSGRYIEKTMKRCSPSRYEVYETATPWAAYVAREYGVVVQPTDGRSLRATVTNSADLVQAHKVFSSIPFIDTCRYWPEIVRVTKPSGYVVFDIVTEECLGAQMLPLWAVSEVVNGSPYPAVMPRRAAIDYFEDNGFTLVGTFFVPMGPGKTELFVFKRREVATAQ